MNTHIMRRTIRNIVLSGASLMVASFSAAQSGADAGAEVEEVKTAFVEIKSQLQTIHSQALQTDTVQKAIEQEDAALKTQLLSAAPEETEVVEELFATRAKLTEATQKQSEAEVEKLQQDLAQINVALGDSLETASNAPEVKRAKEETKKAILTAMNEIEPRTPELIRQQAELFQRYKKLMQQG